MLIFQMNMTLSLNLKPLLWITPFFTRHSSAPQLITKIHLQRELELSLQGLEPPVYHFVHPGMNPAPVLPKIKHCHLLLWELWAAPRARGLRRAGLPKGRAAAPNFVFQRGVRWGAPWAFLCKFCADGACSELGLFSLLPCPLLRIWQCVLWWSVGAPWRQPSTGSHGTSIFCSPFVHGKDIILKVTLYNSHCRGWLSAPLQTEQSFAPDLI